MPTGWDKSASELTLVFSVEDIVAIQMQLGTTLMVVSANGSTRSMLEIIAKLSSLRSLERQLCEWVLKLTKEDIPVASIRVAVFGLVSDEEQLMAEMLLEPLPVS